LSREFSDVILLLWIRVAAARNCAPHDVFASGGLCDTLLAMRASLCALRGQEHVVQGFKISLLLKLEDIKATDRKTTLLQFCIQQAEDKSATVLNLAEDLSVVKQAARLHVQHLSSRCGCLPTSELLGRSTCFAWI
jgi:hypothetical protein